MQEQPQTIRYNRPWLTDYQIEALFGPERYSVVEGSTKAGKTAPCLIWLAEQAMAGQAGQNFWWVAPVFPQAEIAFRRMKRGLPAQFYSSHNSERWVQLINGARIWFKSAEKPDNLYGEDVYAMVIDEATRCFIPGTLVDTPTGPRPIEEIQAGDLVANAAGDGVVRRTIRKPARAVAAVKLHGRTLVSSVDHRYFTQRGWVQAQHLVSEDYVITRNSAVRLLQEAVPASARETEPEILLKSVPVYRDRSPHRSAAVCPMPSAIHRLCEPAVDPAFLRSQLRSEMENGAACDTRKNIQPAGQGENGRWPTAVLGAGYGSDPQNEARLGRSKCDAHPGISGEDGRKTQGNRASATLDRRQGPGADCGTAGALDGIGPRAGLRIAGPCEPDEAGIAEVPLLGFGPQFADDSDRGGREFPPAEKDAVGGQAEGILLEGVRVDGVEILQSGDSRFTHYSGGKGTIDLHDLVVSGHPSFSVHGLLVHNCREESWHACRSTITATRGRVRIIGNVKGRKNWAYKLARRAEAGEAGMIYRKFTALDAVKAGLLPQDEVDQARRDLPEQVFRELYLAEPADDGGNPFGLSAIAACIKPLSSGPPHAWGWDLAKSMNWTVGIALDKDKSACRLQRFQKPWEETLDTITRESGKVGALVDATGVGDPIVERLQRGGQGHFGGFKFTSQSKQQLMEGLAVAIQRQEIAFPDGVIVSELEAFEYVYTRTGVRYSAPEGMDDDCVMALALALRASETSHSVHLRELRI